MLFIILALCFTLATGAPNQARVAWGFETTINQYPSMAAVLHSRDLLHYWQACGGIIISHSSVLTAAHCIYGYRPVNFRFRVGSSSANRDGTVHDVSSMTWHPDFNTFTNEHNVAMFRTTQSIWVTNGVQLARLPYSHLHWVWDNEVVQAPGWGSIYWGARPIEQLHHTTLGVLNLDICKNMYRTLGRVITDNMICANNFVATIPADTCLGDDGGPLYHYDLIVGVASSPSDCGNSYLPAVYTYIPKYLDFIWRNSEWRGGGVEKEPSASI